MRRTQRKKGLGVSFAVALALAACGVTDGGGGSGGVDAGVADSTTRPAPASTSLASFVLYSARSVKVGANTTIAGANVGAGTLVAKSFGPQVIFGKKTELSGGKIVGPTVSLRASGPVSEVDSLTAVEGTDVEVGVHGPYPHDMPALPLATSAAGPKASTPTVGSATTTLKPGVYGDLSIPAGATVLLDPGTFSFHSLTLGAHAGCGAGKGDVVVEVTESVETGDSATIGTTLASAKSFALFVAGRDTKRDAVQLGPKTQVHALVAAPHGTLFMDDGVEAIGAFLGFDVLVGDSVSVKFQDGFTNGGPKGKQPVAGNSANPLDGSFAVLGPAPATDDVHILVALSGPDRAGQTDYANRVSDPDDPLYLHYLSFDEVTKRFSPSADEYAEVERWATERGLRVENRAPNRSWIGVAGSVNAVEAALHANLLLRARRAPSKDSFVTVDRDVSLDTTAPIYWISGLNEYLDNEPESSCCSPAPAHCADRCQEHLDPPATSHPSQKNGSGQKINTTGMFVRNDLYVGSDLRQAYLQSHLRDEDTCTSILGKGQTVGLVGLGNGASFDPIDLDIYRNSNGIGNIHVTAGIGHNPFPAADPTSIEMLLDIEQASGMAPDAEIRVYFSNNLPSWTPVCAMMFPLPGGGQLDAASSSFVLPADLLGQACLEFLAMEGISFYSGAGDHGDVGDPASFKDMDLITLSGGTFLSTNKLASPPPDREYPNPYYLKEETWNEGCPDIDVRYTIDALHGEPACSPACTSSEVEHCSDDPGSCVHVAVGGTDITGGGHHEREADEPREHQPERLFRRRSGRLLSRTHHPVLPEEVRADGRAGRA
jgi:hypothetical protein